MEADEILDKEDIEEGLERLTAPEREQIAPILANVDDQTRFRENIREVGHSTVQRIINKMFPDRNVTAQDFRRSLFQKLCDHYNPGFASKVMHGQQKGEYKVRVEWLGIQDINSNSGEDR